MKNLSAAKWTRLADGPEAAMVKRHRGNDHENYLLIADGLGDEVMLTTGEAKQLVALLTDDAITAILDARHEVANLEYGEVYDFVFRSPDKALWEKLIALTGWKPKEEVKP